MTKNIRTSTNK